MGKLESIIKSEIQRLAKREIRATFIPLRREVRTMRLKLSTLSKGINSLSRTEKELHLEEAKPKLEATPEEVKASRITPDRIRRLRTRLGISMRELGILTGATTGAVLSWEKGKFRPKGEKKSALVALRKVRKRDVRKILTEKAESKIPATQKSLETKTRRKKPGKRMVRRK
jgi:DNA-binding transcriptional regulator YiaG